MIEHRWAVEAATGAFLYGGAADTTIARQYDVAAGLSPGQIRVVLSRAPDTRRERYSGDPASPFRPATPAEIAAMDAARRVEQAQQIRRAHEEGPAAALIWALLAHLAPAASPAQLGVTFRAVLVRIAAAAQERPWLQ